MSAPCLLFPQPRRLPLLHGRGLRALCLALAAVMACAVAHADDCTGPAELESAVQSHPSADAWAALGEWFGEQSQFACAASAFQSAVRLEPDSAQLSYLLGLADFESSNLGDAASALQNSIRDDASALRPHLLLATVYMRLGDPKNAAPAWSAALALDPSNQMALHGLSQCYTTLGNLSAEVDLLKNAALDQDLSVDLATTYMALGQYDDVMDTLRDIAKTATKDDIQSAMAHALLAWALLMEDHPAEALPQARMATDEMASLPLAQIALGRALMDTGDVPAALPVLESALKLDPARLEVHIELARAYAQSGRAPEARRERLLCLQMMAAPAGPTTAPATQQEAAPAQ